MGGPGLRRHEFVGHWSQHVAGRTICAVDGCGKFSYDDIHNGWAALRDLLAGS